MFYNDKQDWNAILSSEIARNYLANEVRKMQMEQELKKICNEEEIFNKFAELQKQINASPTIKNILRNWKNQFFQSQNEVNKNPKLAKALEMFDLEEDDE